MVSNTGLLKAQEKMAKLRAQGIEPERKTWIQKSKEKPTSLRLAINAKCWDCCAEQREEIRRCTVPDCSLYSLRPYKEEGE